MEDPNEDSSTQQVNYQTLSAPATEAPENQNWGRLISLSKRYPNLDLSENEYVFGRSSTCDMRFQDGRVSGVHCRIYRLPNTNQNGEVTGYTVFVHDKSTNGTFINDHLIGKNSKHAIAHQDRISLITQSAKDSIEFIFHDTSYEKNNSKNLLCVPLKGKYSLMEELGQGNFGVVWCALEKETGKQYAIKIVDKTRFALQSTRKEALKDEVVVLQKINHPAIVKLHEVYENDQYLYLVLEKVEGGELFDRIIQKGKYTEAESRQLMKNLLNALEYLHGMGIAHRDLKPENILLASKTNDVDIRLTDFGVSRIVGEDGLFRTLVGTPHYLAPEVISSHGLGPDSGYGAGCDIWSCGVILYILLSGSPPFYENRPEPLLDQVTKGLYTFPPKLFQFVSPGAVDLVKRMLTVDPDYRFTIRECLDHPWMQNKPLQNTFLKKMTERQKRIAARLAQNLPPHPTPEELASNGRASRSKSKKASSSSEKTESESKMKRLLRSARRKAPRPSDSDLKSPTMSSRRKRRRVAK